MCKKGISLISLIITIIVIIILAAIVIFNGFGTTESARFAKYTQEISNYEDEAQQKYMDEKVKSVQEGENKNDGEIYSSMGRYVGETESLVPKEAMQEPLQGEKVYELAETKSLYQNQTGTYITDKGEVFTLPGYKYNVNDEERIYIDSAHYYTKFTNLADEIQVGDYVAYSGVGDSITYDSEVTGWSTVQTLSPTEGLEWRVWSKNSTTGEITIMPVNPVNTVGLGYENGFINSLDVIEEICDMYANSNYNVSPAKVRSLKIEDLEDTKVSPDLISLRNSFVYETENYISSRYGETNVEYVWSVFNPEYEGWNYEDLYSGEYRGYLNGKFYLAEDGVTLLKNPNTNYPVVIRNTAYNASPSWNNIGNSKFNSDTYGNLLGNSIGWLASLCADVCEEWIDHVICIASNNSISSAGMCWSDEDGDDYAAGIRPLVTLGQGLHITGGDGTASSPWTLSK